MGTKFPPGSGVEYQEGYKAGEEAGYEDGYRASSASRNATEDALRERHLAIIEKLAGALADKER